MTTLDDILARVPVRSATDIKAFEQALLYHAKRNGAADAAVWGRDIARWLKTLREAQSNKEAK